MSRVRFCKYCGGKPYRGQGICRECEKRPKAENIKRLRLWNGEETLYDFLNQSNISDRNIKTMESLQDIEDEGFRQFLEIVQEIAKVRPFKRRRWIVIRDKHQALWQRIIENDYFEVLLEEYSVQNCSFDPRSEDS
ncbi:MAG: hypothetical protein MUC43_18455 [Pirellula sp.]|jgi:predicted house-cleaning noncanonical NTP pyrophosphatase (MazG superfamily)|nr:hypothetical protein [Pirellula sp.]